MKGDSVTGKDEISINVIKHIKEFFFFDILPHTFNAILTEGSIPNSFKIALISPVYKGINIHGKLFSYADDTALMISKTSWETPYQNAESDLCIINEWFFQTRFKTKI